MGIVQLNQIRARVLESYGPHVAVGDARDQDAAALTRSLAAWVVDELSGCGQQEAAGSVVDGYQDNGLDAVHVDALSHTVYLIQTKWNSSGNGSVAVGDIHKFVQGFKDLVNAEFTRFNDKVRAKQDQLEAALTDPNVTFTLVLAHTGTGSLSTEGRRVIDDLLDDVNDPIETANFRFIGQSELHGFLKRAVRGAQPDLRVTLHEWGHTSSPYAAYYGQVDASDIAEWFAEFREVLFEKNLREFLGRSSEVNSSVLDTLRTAPQNFWYFNNGITVLCESVTKAAAGSTMKKSGAFEFKGVSVVNGAQTVGCIGELAIENPATVADARVMVRFISLESCPPEFANEVTRGTNTQNHVERRDFVALDSEQSRLRDELAIDGVSYAIKSGVAAPDPASGCTVIEATIALACADRHSDLAVQAKREIGRLWIGAENNTRGSLYRRIFNARTSGVHIWRAVQILREIDRSLALERSTRKGRGMQIGVHGNRVLAHLVFQALSSDYLEVSEKDFANVLTRVPYLTAGYYKRLIVVLNNNFGNNYLASLFKNATRCAEVVYECRSTPLPA